MNHAKKQNRKQLFNFIFIFLGFFLCLFLFYKLNYKKDNFFVLKEYSPSGKLLGTNECIVRGVDTISHGKFINYNVNGIKISEGYFINGHINGKCFYYYDNGRLEEFQYRKNKDITLESIMYYPSGNMQKYEMRTNFGQKVITIDYNKKGEPDNCKGYPQTEIYQHKVNAITHRYEQIKNNFKLGDKLKYSYLIANIPNAKRSFIIENLSIDNTKVKRTFKHLQPCQLDVEEVLTKKGKNKIRNIVQYEFSDKVTPTLMDTLSFDINVK